MENPAQCFIVICRDDNKSDGTPGEYLLATRQTFATRDLAGTYAQGIAPGRVPIVVECSRGLTREAEAAAILKVIPSVQRMSNALAVFILDPKLHAYLTANDPKALEQAIKAVNDYDPGMIEGKIPKSGPSFPVPHEFEPTEPGSDTCQVCGKYKRYEKFHGPLKADAPGSILWNDELQRKIFKNQ